MIVPIENQIENLNEQNIELRQILDRLLPRIINGKLQVKGHEFLLNSKTEIRCKKLNLMIFCLTQKRNNKNIDAI